MRVIHPIENPTPPGGVRCACSLIMFERADELEKVGGINTNLIPLPAKVNRGTSVIYRKKEKNMLYLVVGKIELMNG